MSLSRWKEFEKQLEFILDDLSRIQPRFKNVKNRVHDVKPFVSDPVIVLVTGLMRSGKSSFLNFLINAFCYQKEREICPSVAIGSFTLSCLWKYKFGEKARVDMMRMKIGDGNDGVKSFEVVRSYELGRKSKRWKKQFETISTEIGSISTNTKIIEAHVYLPFEKLKHIEFWDSPGIDKSEGIEDHVLQENEKADVTLYITDITLSSKGFSDSHIQFINRIHNRKKAIFFIINQIDKYLYDMPEPVWDTGEEEEPDSILKPQSVPLHKKKKLEKKEKGERELVNQKLEEGKIQVVINLNRINPIIELPPDAIDDPKPYHFTTEEIEEILEVYPAFFTCSSIQSHHKYKSSYIDLQDDFLRFFFRYMNETCFKIPAQSSIGIVMEELNQAHLTINLANRSVDISRKFILATKIVDSNLNKDTMDRLDGLLENSVFQSKDTIMKEVTDGANLKIKNLKGSLEDNFSDIMSEEFTAAVRKRRDFAFNETTSRMMGSLYEEIKAFEMNQDVLFPKSVENNKTTLVRGSVKGSGRLNLKPPSLSSPSPSTGFVALGLPIEKVNSRVEGAVRERKSSWRKKKKNKKNFTIEEWFEQTWRRLEKRKKEAIKEWRNMYSSKMSEWAKIQESRMSEFQGSKKVPEEVLKKLYLSEIRLLDLEHSYFYKYRIKFDEKKFEIGVMCKMVGGRMKTDEGERIDVVRKDIFMTEQVKQRLSFSREVRFMNLGRCLRGRRFVMPMISCFKNPDPKIHCSVIFRKFTYTLEEIIVKKVDIEDSTRVNFLLDIVTSVKYLHSRGIIHGNLRPSNIVVAHDNKLMLTDFFSTRVTPLRPKVEDEFCFPYSDMYYALKNNKTRYPYLEQNVDVFSIGVIIAHLWTRKPASDLFRPEYWKACVDLEDMVAMEKWSDVILEPFEERLREGVGKDIEELARRCTRLSLSNRITVGELLRKLKDLQQIASVLHDQKMAEVEEETEGEFEVISVSDIVELTEEERKRYPKTM